MLIYMRRKSQYFFQKIRFKGKGESIGDQSELCREYIRTHYGDQTADSAVVYWSI